MVCILAIVDPHNSAVPAGLEAFTVGLVVLVVGLSMGFNSGYAVNPPRDLGRQRVHVSSPHLLDTVGRMYHLYPKGGVWLGMLFGL